MMIKAINTFQSNLTKSFYYLSYSLNDSESYEHIQVPSRCQGGQEGEDCCTKNPKTKQLLPSKHLGQPAPGDLGDYVAVEKCPQNKTLGIRVPVEFTL